jgi:hypothetical protein
MQSVTQQAHTITIPLSWLNPTGREKVYLRRYVEPAVDVEPCPDMPGIGSYHQARTYIGVRRIEWDDTGRRVPPRLADYRDHGRWPTQCTCGRHFTDEDWRQVQTERLFVNWGQQEYTLPSAPPGSIWSSPFARRKGPDGRSLVVRLPDGTDWLIDYDHERTGEVPGITVVGSHESGAYTASITGGILTFA